MTKTSGILLILMILAAGAFADIKPPVRPAPTSPVVRPAAANEAQMTVSVSRWSEQPTLALSKAAIAKINAAANPNEKTAPASLSAQTLVGGIFLSLAFVFGGVWLARSKGQDCPKPVLGILLLAVVGMGATLVIGNVPPPKRIGLTSAIIDSKVLGNYVAAGKVKIMVVDYDTKDDISLILPKKDE